MSFRGKKSIGQACASCKYQRRKCSPNCIFAPHFPPDQMEQFLSVHRLFGVSNVQKMLKDLPPHERSILVRTLVYHANARKRDPVHGCLGILRTLNAEAEHLTRELQIINQQQRQQQQQQFRPSSSSQFFQPPLPMINTGETSYSNNLRDDRGFHNLYMDPAYAYPPPPYRFPPPPPLFQDFEGANQYRRYGDFQDRQAFAAYDEVVDESRLESVESSQRPQD